MNEIKKVIKADLLTIAKQLIRSTEVMEIGCPDTIRKVAEQNREMIKKLNLDG